MRDSNSTFKKISSPNLKCQFNWYFGIGLDINFFGGIGISLTASMINTKYVHLKVVLYGDIIFSDKCGVNIIKVTEFRNLFSLFQFQMNRRPSDKQ